MSDWATVALGELVVNFNSARRPIKATERATGSTPYYGASGIVDWVDGFTHDGEYLLISEDGENLRSRSLPIAFGIEGRSWVNNHVHVVAGKFAPDSRFLRYALACTDVTGYLTGSAQPKLSKSAMESIRLRVPPKGERQAIAEVLGTLDKKVAANDSVVASCNGLAEALLRKQFVAEAPLAAVAYVTMGSSPPGESYNYTGVGIPFYQGVRDFGVRFPGRRVWTTAPVRLAKMGETLVSVRAPVGRTNIARENLCLGRGLAALRSKAEHPMTLFHQVRAAHAAWAPYEAEGTVFGSINRSNLEAVVVPTVGAMAADALESDLASVEARVKGALAENERLSSARDELLPLLMSGKVRVKDAEKVVEEVL